ncbi:MAG: hypothetical protein AABY28_04795 [Candidatus Omnitrophota bacterium]
MRFGWETKKEKILKGAKISAQNKLEGFRLINELADKVLTGNQKAMRRKLRGGLILQR